MPTSWALCKGVAPPHANSRSFHLSAHSRPDSNLLCLMMLNRMTEGGRSAPSQLVVPPTIPPDSLQKQSLLAHVHTHTHAVAHTCCCCRARAELEQAHGAHATRLSELREQHGQYTSEVARLEQEVEQLNLRAQELEDQARTARAEATDKATQLRTAQCAPLLHRTI